MNNRCLVIDSNAMCYRSLYTIGGLSNDSDRTGVIFGFLNQVFRYAKQYKSNDIIFCWDSDTSLRRMLYDENYKTGRAEKRKELSKKERSNLQDAYKQFNKLREEVLFDLGFKNIFQKKGFESDDLIAVIVKETRKDIDYLIISNDNDLWQLITDRVSYLGMRDGKIIDVKGFKKEHEIIPMSWAEVKAIAGCKGDDVIGIKGIGEKKAIDYILSRSKPNDKKKIEDNYNTIICNRPLVYLPFEHKFKLEIKENNFSREKFSSVFNDLGFKSLLEKSYFDNLMKVFI